jgi:hypothetical protein
MENRYISLRRSISRNNIIYFVKNIISILIQIFRQKEFNLKIYFSEMCQLLPLAKHLTNEY